MNLLVKALKLPLMLIPLVVATQIAAVAYLLGVAIAWCLILLFAVAVIPLLALDFLLQILLQRRREKVKPHKEKGDEYRTKGEYCQATVEYSRAIALNRHDPHLYWDRASTYHMNQEFTLAVADYSNALGIDPYVWDIANYRLKGVTAGQQITIYESRGQSYVAMSKYDLAIADFSTAIEESSKTRYSSMNVEVFHYRGLAHLAEGNYGLAIADFNKYLGLDRNGIHIQDAFESRGKAYEAMGKSDLAVADFQAAERVYWDVEDYLFNAEDCLASGDWDLAISDCTTGIKLEQENAQLYYCRASAYYSKGEHGLAIADYTVAIGIDTDEVFWQLYREEGEHEGMATAYHSRGLAHLADGNHRAAISDLQKAVGFYSGRMDFHSSLAKAMVAKEEHDQKISSDLGADASDIEGLLNKIEEFFSEGDYDLAIEFCTALMDMMPESYLPYQKRGLAYHAKEQYELAKTDFEVANHLSSKRYR